jgi:hypothetical protein
LAILQIIAPEPIPAVTLRGNGGAGDDALLRLRTQSAQAGFRFFVHIANFLRRGTALQFSCSNSFFRPGNLASNFVGNFSRFE